MRKMKKVIGMMMVGAMTLSLLTGCSSNNKVTGSVATDGSTSMEKVIGGLGEAFQNDTGITFTYNPTGSGSGITGISGFSGSGITGSGSGFGI